jgi:hypothetical protein
MPNPRRKWTAATFDTISIHFLISQAVDGLTGSQCLVEEMGSHE